MYALKNLWRGQISPSERYIYEDSPYWRISRKYSDALDAFFAMISPEAQKQYEKMEQLA